MSLLDRLDLGFARKTPLILQTEAAECGLASLAMVSGFHGQSYDLTQLRRRFGSSLKGVTLKDIVQLGEKIGFASRPLRLELDELHRLKTPCILHWDLNHFVVLVKVTQTHITIHDPAIGVRRLPMAEVSRSFTGVALELTPTEEFRKNTPPTRVKITQLFGQFVGLKRTMFYLFGLALVIELLSLINPLFMSWVVDHAIVSADRELLHTLAIGFGLIMLFQVGIKWLRNWSLMGLNASISLQSRENLMTHLLRLPVSFFEARHLGDILSRFGSQETILNTVTEEFISAILDGIMTFVTLAVMVMIAPQLTAFAIAGAVIYTLLRWISYSPLRQAEMESIVWSAKAESNLLETLRGIRSVKLYNAQSLRRIQWINLNVETVNRDLLGQKVSIVLGAINEALVGLLTILIIWMGAQAILNSEMTVGLLLAFMAYLGVFLGRISTLIDTVVQLWMLRLHAERLSDIALAAPEQAEREDSIIRPLQRSDFSMELKSISYRYSESEPFVLKDVSFRIEAGEWVAITGPSGSGKSTLLKILSGLLQPTSGEILINGEPLSKIGMKAYRDRVGVVLQDDQLFSGSIADNITFFADKPDQERIEECAQLASIYDDVVSMPMGFQTLLGDMGTVLSGGQKQRILMARALYRDPDLLLLDEATSHLDVDNEERVNEAISFLNITRIIIAHRPETIQAAERVIVLENGEILGTDEMRFAG